MTITCNIEPGKPGHTSDCEHNRRGRKRSSLRADLAKAQARCAEMEAALTKFMHMGRGDGPTGLECRSAAIRALASDGTSALAAVRLAQRALAHVVEHGHADECERGGECDDAAGGKCDVHRHNGCPACECSVYLAVAAVTALAEAFGSGE